jgi:NAD(P)-dependent dehydrogenase (short-subunit alcohol dehydrogenase family)
MNEISMANLSGKTVLVTGAAMGIGRSLAMGLHAAGANLVLVDVMRDPLEALRMEIEAGGGNAYAAAMDISDAEAAHALRNQVQQSFGQVDVLVNNAAIGPEKNSPRYLAEKPKFWTTRDDLWLAMLRVNVFGAQLMTRVFVDDMLSQGWGRIVNITTSLDTMYRPGIGAYGPCKAALEALTRIMAQDLEGTGVTANVLVPGGPVNTRMVPAESGLMPSDLIQPAQMQAPLLWLCTEEANTVNGMRFVAQKWNADSPSDVRLRNATAPVAWPQLGAQSVFPTAS